MTRTWYAGTGLMAIFFWSLPFVFASGCDGTSKDKPVVRVFSDFPSLGLVQDANIVREFLDNPGIAVVTERANPDDKVLANIFFESVNKDQISKAQFNWIYVNQELAQEASFYEDIDLVFAKSRIAVELMRKFREKHGLKFRIFYTKFTSPYTGQFIPTGRDPQLFLHGAGQSPFKNTNAVLDAWLANPHFPKVVVTCRTLCADWILSKRTVSTGPNIELYQEKLPAEDIQRFQSTAGFCLCPSAVEGYGHYINECRASGAVVITTDAGPMNELIEHGISGILVPPDSMQPFNGNTNAEAANISKETLARAVENALRLSDSERQNMALKARQGYDSDREFLKSRLSLIAGSLAKHGNLDSIGHLLE